MFSFGSGGIKLGSSKDSFGFGAKKLQDDTPISPKSFESLPDFNSFGFTAENGDQEGYALIRQFVSGMVKDLQTQEKTCDLVEKALQRANTLS